MDNLLSNAIKFSLVGSSVQVHTRTANHHWWVDVADEGPGLSEEDLSKMFKKFQRLSARPTGGESSTGLGYYKDPGAQTARRNCGGKHSGQGNYFYLKISHENKFLKNMI